MTTNIQQDVDILRVHLEKGVANLQMDCDVKIDQIRAIDNKRLIKKVGKLSTDYADKIKENLSILFDLE